MNIENIRRYVYIFILKRIKLTKKNDKFIEFLKE